MEPPLFEDYATRPIPQKETKTGLQIGWIIWGICICIPAFMVGNLVGRGAPLFKAFLAILAGAVILALIASATGLIGSRTRMSTAMSSSFTFGRSGSLAIALLLAAGSFGWFGVQLELFGVSLVEAGRPAVSAPGFFPLWGMIVFGGGLMTLSALFGFRGIAKLTNWAIPFLLLLMGFTLWRVLDAGSILELPARLPAEPKPFGWLVSAIVGAFAVGAIIMPDITRYGVSSRQTLGGVLFGLLGGFPLIIAVSALLVIASGQADFTAILLDQPNPFLKWFAIIAVVLATWTTNDNNLYSSALAFSPLLPKVPKWGLTLIGGGLGTALALAGLMQGLVGWMILLGITVPPVGAVMAADFVLFRREAYRPEALPDLPAFRWKAWAAWGMGTAAGYLSYFGKLPLLKTPALDSILTAFVAYCFLMKAFDDPSG